jgi:DNA-binding transcriptional ArsR family regulator
MSDTERRPALSERGTEGHTVDLDAVFDALSSQRRRAVVHCLASRSGAAPVDALAERIAAWERDERVAASLRHSHLPKLAALGLVDYDERSETARFEGHAAAEEWLDHAAALSLPGSL